MRDFMRRCIFSWPSLSHPSSGVRLLVMRRRSRCANGSQRPGISSLLPGLGKVSRGNNVVEGDTSTVHRYGRGATSVLRVSAVRASRLRIGDRMN
eukprot:6197963-Pleurochrysis_carterae.AAC.3